MRGEDERGPVWERGRADDSEQEVLKLIHHAGGVLDYRVSQFLVISESGGSWLYYT